MEIIFRLIILPIPVNLTKYFCSANAERNKEGDHGLHLPQGVTGPGHQYQCEGALWEREEHRVGVQTIGSVWGGTVDNHG